MDRVRRTVLQWCAALAGATLLPGSLQAGTATALLRRIPSSGEAIPPIGMGSWLTFDVGSDDLELAERCRVLQTFLDGGGTLVDSSPMYGSAEAVIGHCLERVQGRERLFAATKVWTYGKGMGLTQMEHSRRLWGVERFHLMQIHNLLDWEAHLESLRRMKSAGAVRYIGLTTSHGRRHAELERIMRQEEGIDFVQFTYNIADREAERRLLPLAAERGIAVICNRPFKGGALFKSVHGRALPTWAAEIGCDNWAQFFLKFIIGHPAVTCAIPATSQVAHMHENIGALQGALPDAAMRRQMAQTFATH